MNILVANNHLKRTGGTENYTYALIVELLRLKHDVEYFTYNKGYVSKKIEALGVKFRSKKSYDLILANHTSTIQLLHHRGFVIQTCHGTLPSLEQPSRYADAYVSVTKEVYKHLIKKGVESTIIRNGIDCERFNSTRELNARLSCVLSLCQSDEANALIGEVCKQNKITFLSADKKMDNVWHLERLINEADMVVGIGRSLYDAMACGRTVLSFDKRKYSLALGDGYLDSGNINESIRHNCSGRGTGKNMDATDFEREIRKYKSDDGRFLREYALQHLNIRHSVQQYLELFNKKSAERTKKPGHFVSPLLYYKARVNRLPSYSIKGIVNWLLRKKKSV